MNRKDKELVVALKGALVRATKSAGFTPIEASAVSELLLRAGVRFESEPPRKASGLSGLQNGTRLYTEVRMQRKAAGERRRVEATVRDGLLFVSGLTRGFDRLSSALESARGQAGKANRKYSSTGGTRAWRLVSTGETVEEHRKGAKAGKRSRQMSLEL